MRRMRLTSKKNRIVFLSMGVIIIISVALWGWRKLVPPTIRQRLDNAYRLLSEGEDCAADSADGNDDEGCQDILQRAATEYYSVIRIQPKNTEAYLGLGAIYLNGGDQGYKNGDLSKALANWRKAVQLEPRSAYAHSKLAQTLYYLGQHAAADREERIAHRLWAHRGSYMWTIPHDSQKDISKRK